MTVGLAAILRAAYADQRIPARVVETHGGVAIEDDGYRLDVSTAGPLTVTVEGEITRDAYYALGLADEQTEGAISRALDETGRPFDAEQVRFSLSAIQSGRGPIYGEGQGR